MKIKIKTILSLTVRISISCILLWILYVQIKKSGNLSEFFTGIKQIFYNVRGRSFVYLAFFVFFLSNIFSVLQWKGVLKLHSINVSYFKLFVLYYTGLFFCNFLPSNIGGDIFRSYGLIKIIGDSKKSISSILYDRFLSFFALLFIGFIAGIFLIGQVQLFILSLIVISLFSIALIILVVIQFNFFYTIVEKIISFILKKGKIHNYLIEFVNSFKALKVRLEAIPVFIFAVIAQFFRTLLTFMVSMAIGLKISLILFLLTVPLVGLSTVIPLSINGIGIREYIGKTVLEIAGNVSIENSVLLFFTGYIIIVISSLPGGIMFVIKNYNKKK